MRSRPIVEAILLLQLARDRLDTDASQRDPKDLDRQDLIDVAEDLTPLLLILEALVGPDDGKGYTDAVGAE